MKSSVLLVICVFLACLSAPAAQPQRSLPCAAPSTGNAIVDLILWLDCQGPPPPQRLLMPYVSAYQPPAPVYTYQLVALPQEYNRIHPTESAQVLVKMDSSTGRRWVLYVDEGHQGGAYWKLLNWWPENGDV